MFTDNEFCRALLCLRHCPHANQRDNRKPLLGSWCVLAFLSYPNLSLHPPAILLPNPPSAKVLRTRRTCLRSIYCYLLVADVHKQPPSLPL
jgi:hypothetical protein